MTVTYGLNFSGSSESAALAQFLASKLQVKTALLGSTMFKLTWKVRVTPLGRLIYAHRASARTTSAKGSTSWPTPVSQPANGTPERFLERKQESIQRGSQMGLVLSDIAMVAQLTNWPTPRAEERQQANSADNYQALSKEVGLAMWMTPKAHDGEFSTPRTRPMHKSTHLQTQAIALLTDKDPTLANWPTPNVPNGGRVPAEEVTLTQRRPNGDKAQVSLEAMARMSNWPTPQKGDGERGGQASRAENKTHAQRLVDWAQLAATWATPTTRDHKDGENALEQVPIKSLLSRQVLLSTSGPTPTGSTAVMVSGGQLNPGLSRWLMGYPLAWDMCAPEKAKKSSARSKKKPSPELGGSKATATP